MVALSFLPLTISVSVGGVQPHPSLPSQSLASQCHQSSTSQASPLPTSRPPSDDTCIPTDPSNHQYICTLCRKEMDGPQNSAARDTRKACVDCSKRMYRVSICWACGEVVHQKLDAISLRWYWCQLSYFFCLLCGVSLYYLLEQQLADLSGT